MVATLHYIPRQKGKYELQTRYQEVKEARCTQFTSEAEQVKGLVGAKCSLIHQTPAKIITPFRQALSSPEPALLTLTCLDFG